MREPPQRSDAIAVCGAGAAGMAAALAAAQCGRDVWLIDAHSDIGGTVAHSLIHTLGGLYDSAGEAINGGLCTELISRLEAADSQTAPRRIGRTWVLNVAPRIYAPTTRAWMAEFGRIHVVCSARVTGVVVDRHRVQEIVVSVEDESFNLKPSAVIDATGTAAVVRQIEPEFVEDDRQAAAGGLIFTLRNVPEGALVYPRNLGLLRDIWSAAEEGRLPSHCGKAWLDSGVYPDEIYVKLFVPLGHRWAERWDEIVREARTCQSAILDFVKRMPRFASAELGRTGEVGVRDGGRILGEYLLSGDDVRRGAKFDDAVCRCAWPIEYWHPVTGVSLEYLPDGSSYEIPLRALRLKGYENVWAAGKCFSADRYAQASARVAGTCWAMGEAAGRAAAGRCPDVRMQTAGGANRPETASRFRPTVSSPD